MKIKLTKIKANFRPETARALYWEAMAKYDGKEMEDFIKDMDANPPKLPKSGKPEKASGWVKFFAKEELIKLS